jgi:hypothetical protein
MALTLPVEQRLEKVNLVTYFNDHQGAWLDAARKAHDYLAEDYDTIRPDDVAKILHPIVEASKEFKAQLAGKNLTQRGTRYMEGRMNKKGKSATGDRKKSAERLVREVLEQALGEKPSRKTIVLAADKVVKSTPKHAA